MTRLNKNIGSLGVLTLLSALVVFVFIKAINSEDFKMSFDDLDLDNEAWF